MSITHNKAVANAKAPSPLGALGLLALGVLALAWLWAEQVECSVAQWLHAPCPSCGTTRSFRALMEGDVLTALTMNPAGLAVGLLIGAMGIRAIYLLATEGSLIQLGRGPIGRPLTVALLGAFTAEVLLWAVRFLGLFGGPVPV